MGKQPGAGQAKQALLAFHAAVLRHRKETGRLEQPIPTADWEAAMCRTLSEGGALLTRQSCADKTWFLERSGLIQRKEREGILVLEPGVAPFPAVV